MRAVSGVMLSWLALPVAFAADLTPETQRAFDRYIALTETALARNLSPQSFLYGNFTAQQKANLRNGNAIIVPRETLDRGKEIEVAGGLIQDWLGAVFLRGATIPQVRAILQNYEAYRDYYKPEVIDSKLLRHNDDEYDIFLRLYKKQFVTVVLNATYHVQYGGPDPDHMYVNSRSTRIAEVKNPDRSMTDEEKPGHDDGFLWALNSYWRFKQADGGVYAQLEAISLSRDLPFGLMWLKGFLQKFPRDSMEATLRGTRRAVEASIKDENRARH